ncbi:MAG: hypothetical protein ACYDAY_10880 [Candidatus Dormibacteria bacterium]
MHFPWRGLALLSLGFGAWILWFGLTRGLGLVAIGTGLVMTGFGSLYLLAYAVVRRHRTP